jgi:hypothetical protein
MARRSRKRPYGEPHPELDVERITGGFPARLEAGPGSEPFYVAISRQRDKTYVCPACGQDIPAMTNHVVAWAAGGLFGPAVAEEERRHWHTACWERFGRQHE